MSYPTLRQTLEKFVSDEACHEHLGRIRWPTGPRCPKCRNADVIRFQAKGKTGKPRNLSSKRRISAKEVERMLGVSYETAWNMHHRVSQAMEKEHQKAFLQKLI